MVTVFSTHCAVVKMEEELMNSDSHKWKMEEKGMRGRMDSD
jgi:hypothetical protein